MADLIISGRQQNWGFKENLLKWPGPRYAEGR